MVSRFDSEGLLPRTASRLAFFLLFLFVPLFLSAGTLDWAEAWIYFFISIGYMIPTVFYLKQKDPEILRRRTDLRPQEGSDKVISFAGAAAFIGCYVVAGLDFRYGWSLVTLEIKALAFAETSEPTLQCTSGPPSCFDERILGISAGTINLLVGESDSQIERRGEIRNGFCGRGPEDTEGQRQT